MVEVGAGKFPVKESSLPTGENLLTSSAAVKIMSNKIDQTGGDKMTKRPPDAMLKLGPGSVALQEGDELMLEVTCGQNQALLYMSRLQLGSKGTCVLFDNSWLTPNEFQYVSGRETAKDWKRSIKHHGKSLKVLIAKGILTTNPLRCNCGQCSQMREKSDHKKVSTSEDPLNQRSEKDPNSNQNALLNKNSPTGGGSCNSFFKSPGESRESAASIISPIINFETNVMPQNVTTHSLDGARIAQSVDGASCCYRNESAEETAARNAACRLFPTSPRTDVKDRANNNNVEVKSDSSFDRRKSMDASSSTDAKMKIKKTYDDFERTRKETTQDDRSERNPSTSDLNGSNKKLHSSGSHSSGQNHTKNSNSSLDTKQIHHSENPGKSSSCEKSTKKQLTPSAERQTSAMISLAEKYRGMMPERDRLVISETGMMPASETPYVFPPYTTPCYPMVPSAQLPMYYPNPYILPMPFPTTPAFPYGWTAPPDMMSSPNCMMSSAAKDIMDRREAAAAAASHGSSTSSIFNFPWMKRHESGANYSGEHLLHGKRKLEDDSYSPAAKHPYYFPDGPRPSLMSEGINWPQLYPPSLDFRFMSPCDLSSCIPDGRNFLANSYLKANENHMSNMNLYPSLYPSPYIGISSR